MRNKFLSEIAEPISNELLDRDWVHQNTWSREQMFLFLSHRNIRNTSFPCNTLTDTEGEVQEEWSYKQSSYMKKSA
jgi:hypothetical protein